MKKGVVYQDNNGADWIVLQVLPDRECIMKRVGSYDIKTASIKYFDEIFHKKEQNDTKRKK